MVNTSPREGETLRELAARYGRSYDTLSAQWSRHPAWPPHTGKRGRAYLYDPAQVDKVVREHFIRDDVPLAPRRLYTAQEIATLTGISAQTIRVDVSRGRWPAADSTEGPASRWYGKTVMATLANRRGYRRRSTDA